MKRSLSALGISGILVWACLAQNAERPANSEPANLGSATSDTAYYASLNRRVLESRTQFDLLSALAQEHKKRAAETPGDQASKAQWETELAKELDQRAALVLDRLNTASKERLAFEQRHPDLAGSGLATSSSPANAAGSDELAFLGKLNERLVAVQQEIADALEAGKLYQAQLRTNTGTYDFARTSSLLQENGNEVKRLQKEVSDLELMRLEFRALRQEH